jgi:hypothetical protein
MQCSVHHKGSGLVQQAIEVATPEEIDKVAAHLLFVYIAYLVHIEPA